MPKWFTVTIDTEGDRACPFLGNRWGPLTGRYDSVVHAIPELRVLWNAFSVLPVYLTTPEVLSCPACVDVLKAEQNAGAEIGTHLHIGDAFPCTVPEEGDHLLRLTALYERAFGSTPRCYRAGRYGMSDRTLGTLRNLGYHVDTSVTPHVDWSGQGGPDYTGYPMQPYWARGILEVPVTVLGLRRWWLFNGWSKYRWLRPSVARADDLKSVVDSACEMGITVLNMTFHTMELVPGASPYVRTFVGVYFYLMRLDTIIGYMMERGFEPITLSGLHTLWTLEEEGTRYRANVG
jgi:hypothetical protein